MVSPDIPPNLRMHRIQETLCMGRQKEHLKMENMSKTMGGGGNICCSFQPLFDNYGLMPQYRKMYPPHI